MSPFHVNFYFGDLEADDSYKAGTSLGGVESLIEQRQMSDEGADPKVLRISVGLEDLEVSFRTTLE